MAIVQSCKIGDLVYWDLSFGDEQLKEFENPNGTNMW